MKKKAIIIIVILYAMQTFLLASSFEDDYNYLLKRESSIHNYEASYDIIEFSLPKSSSGDLENLKALLSNMGNKFEIDQFYSDVQKLFPNSKFIKREIQKSEQGGRYIITESFNGENQWFRSWNKDKLITYTPEQKKQIVAIYPNEQNWATHGLDSLCMKGFLPDNPSLISSSTEDGMTSYVIGQKNSDIAVNTVYDDNLSLQYMKIKYKNSKLYEKWFYGYEVENNIPMPKFVLDVKPKRGKLSINLICVKDIEINKKFTEDDFVIQGVPPSALYIDYSQEPPILLGRVGEIYESTIYGALENEIIDEDLSLFENKGESDIMPLLSEEDADEDTENIENDTEDVIAIDSSDHQEKKIEKGFKLPTTLISIVFVILILILFTLALNKRNNKDS